jgi:tetratricopeptide (TPR) repeat protein
MKETDRGDWGYSIGIKHCEFILRKIDEEDAFIHSNCGVLLWEKGDIEEAKECYERAIDIDPALAQVHYNYALLLSNEGETEEAKQRFNQATDANPLFARAHYSLAKILHREGKASRAGDRYEQAIRSDADYSEAYNDYALLLSNEGKTECAMECFKKAVSSDPNNTKARANYGDRLVESEPALAVEHLETAVQSWLNEEQFGNALDIMLKLAIANFDTEEQSQAYQTCVTAIEIASAMNPPSDVVGWAWKGIDDPATDEPEMLARLGMAAVVRGQFNIGHSLFETLWEVRDSVGDDIAQMAGVGAATFRVLSDVDGDIIETILADINPEELSDPVQVVYDYLVGNDTSGEGGRGSPVPGFVLYPREVSSEDQRIENVSFRALENGMFGILSAHLRDEM